MKIKIDGRDILVTDTNKNIVEIAEENGITITAPCFRNNKKNGCCNACVIEANGTQKYACATKPEDGMNITYKREDLDVLRKERLEKYAKAIKTGDASGNNCGCTDTKELLAANSTCDCSTSACDSSASACDCSASSCDCSAPSCDCSAPSCDCSDSSCDCSASSCDCSDSSCDCSDSSCDCSDPSSECSSSSCCD